MQAKARKSVQDKGEVVEWGKHYNTSSRFKFTKENPGSLPAREE
jgi:hypothetical protein